MSSEQRYNGSGNLKDSSLCMDCANATKPHKCPWVENYTPVEDWWARETVIRGKSTKGDIAYLSEIPSYTVIMCPLFERDGYAAGVYKASAEKHPVLKSAENDDIRKLCAAIIHRAVLDWKLLDYGSFEKLMTTENQTIKSETLIAFFHSSLFYEMLSVVSAYTPAQVREILRVP